MYARRIHPSRFPDYRYQGKTPRPDLSFGSTSTFTPLKAFSSDSSLGILGVALEPQADVRAWEFALVIFRMQIPIRHA